jgi:dihydrofolate reductase
MRKIIVSMMISADGYIEDRNGSIDWHVWDGEMEQFMLGFFDQVDMMVFGRKTYQLMESYWPTESGSESPLLAAKMNGLPKTVISTTLKSAGWETTTLLHEVDAKTIHAMKQQPGKDIVIFGGAKLIASFRQLGLIDEYNLFINPVALGGGTPFFGSFPEALRLRQIDTRPFKCGNVLISYQSLNVQGANRSI